MTDISAEVDLSDVEKGLRKLDKLTSGSGLRPILVQLRKPLRADQRAHAKAEEGSGGKWPSRAASTVAAIKLRRRAARRARKSGLKRRSIARRLLGRLPGALDVRIEGKSLIARSKVAWSGAHQDGDSHVPAREFLWISDGVLEDAATVTGDAMLKAFGP